MIIEDPTPVTTLAMISCAKSWETAESPSPAGTINAPKRYKRFLPNTSDILDNGNNGTIIAMVKLRFTQTIRLALV